MKCQELVRRIEQFQPGACPREVARVCLLLANGVESTDRFADEDALFAAWKETCLRIQAATDQHAAMTEELEALANSDPRQFSPDQIWVLIRAIKVQSQILQMYLGYPVLDV
jgi:hypothetical protein